MYFFHFWIVVFDFRFWIFQICLKRFWYMETIYLRKRVVGANIFIYYLIHFPSSQILLCYFKNILQGFPVFRVDFTQEQTRGNKKPFNKFKKNVKVDLKLYLAAFRGKSYSACSNVSSSENSDLACEHDFLFINKIPWKSHNIQATLSTDG